MRMLALLCIIVGLLMCAFMVDVVKCVEHYTEKPAFLTSCRINEPQFDDCSKNTVQQLLDQLAIGIPEVVESFGPFDPLRTRDIQFKQDNNEAAQLNVNLTNVIIKGLSNIRVVESRVSKKDYSWYNRLFIPKMRLDGEYKMQGRILLIPLNGSGKLYFEIVNLDVIMLTKTRLYDKGGFTFDNVTDVRVKLNMTRVRTHLDNLLNGYGNGNDIERSVNQFFNDNWRDFYEALKPVIVSTVANFMYDLMHKVFNLIPANFFVEDIPTAEQFYGMSKTVGGKI